MTIRIPDDLARDLEGIATAQNKSVEQVAVEGTALSLGQREFAWSCFAGRSRTASSQSRGGR